MYAVKKIEGWSFWTGISVKGWRRIGQVRRYKTIPGKIDTAATSILLLHRDTSPK